MELPQCLQTVACTFTNSAHLGQVFVPDLDSSGDITVTIIKITNGKKRASQKNCSQDFPFFNASLAIRAAIQTEKLITAAIKLSIPSSKTRSAKMFLIRKPPKLFQVETGRHSQYPNKGQISLTF